MKRVVEGLNIFDVHVAQNLDVASLIMVDGYNVNWEMLIRTGYFIRSKWTL